MATTVFGMLQPGDTEKNPWSRGPPHGVCFGFVGASPAGRTGGMLFCLGSLVAVDGDIRSLSLHPSHEAPVVMNDERQSNNHNKAGTGPGIIMGRDGTPALLIFLCEKGNLINIHTPCYTVITATGVHVSQRKSVFNHGEEHRKRSLPTWHGTQVSQRMLNLNRGNKTREASLRRELACG